MKIFIIMCLWQLLLILFFCSFVCSWRYRKFVKPVFDRLTTELHRHRVVSGLFDRIVDHVSAIVFRHDFCVYEVTEITQTRAHTRRYLNILREMFHNHTI